MVNIRPFISYRFDEKKVDISKAVLPPYELSNEEFKKTFFNLSPFNVIRIYLGKEDSKNNGERYEYSKQLFNSWIREGVVKKDKEPCLYVYSQEFEIDGKVMERTGFVALVELEEFGKNIFPHEETLEETMVNRRVLLEKTKTNFGLIFSVYDDEEKKIEAILEEVKRNKPIMDFFTDFEGVRHRVWVLKDQKKIKEIAKEMKNKKLLIADGHHRYKVCLEYSKKHKNVKGSKYISMMMVNIKNKGLVILPTHRLVKGLKNFDRNEMLEKLKKWFSCEIFTFKTEGDKERLSEIKNNLGKRDGKHFGVYFGGNNYFIIRLKDEKIMEKEVSNFSKVWRSFDVSILHTLILKKILGIDTEKPEAQSYVEYVKDFKDNGVKCITKMERGEYQVAFFLNPIKAEKLKDISENKEMIPAKSTCFYPKVYCGVLMQKLDECLG